MNEAESLELAAQVLSKIYQDHKAEGLLSIYLWGSAVTPDFGPQTSDIDAIGILADEADFKKLNKMRDWLPSYEPRLHRLQINFIYLSELRGGPKRSNLARLDSAAQAVYDFPNWKYIAGQRFTPSDFPTVTPQQAVSHQARLAETKLGWALSGEYGDMGLQYFCKGLAWLCYSIHKLSTPPSPFSWSGLKAESTAETKGLIETLAELKATRWDPDVIRAKMPYLQQQAHTLIKKYKA